MTKDNIMKQTDGLFHRVFEEVAAEYPDIESEHQIIDIGAARVAAQPEQFDVVVTLNLYGDILSDIAAQVAGSVGLVGSANVGDAVSMFEAVHGSAPDIAGKGVANPSGLIHAATQMLVHLGEADVAESIKNAWLCTLESGIHTADVYRPGLSEREVGTDGFVDAVIERLGERPRRLRPVAYRSGGIEVRPAEASAARKELVGVDVFVDWSEGDRDPDTLGASLGAAAAKAGWRLEMITNRGVKVFPGGIPETFKTDHWRCRFMPEDDGAIGFDRVLEVLTALHAGGHDVIKTEHLYTFDGARGFSLGQGQ
jgi:isocitrate dehydrogenase